MVHGRFTEGPLSEPSDRLKTSLCRLKYLIHDGLTKCVTLSSCIPVVSVIEDQVQGLGFSYDLGKIVIAIPMVKRAVFNSLRPSDAYMRR